MAPQPVAFEFPLGGVSKRYGFENQKPQTTPSALNFWPIEWSTGRARGGVRPGLTTTGGAPSGTPLNWCYASWVGGYGVAVTTTNGTYLTTDGADWSPGSIPGPVIAAPTSSVFACPTLYNNYVIQADFGGAVDTYNIGGASAQTLASEVTAGTAPTNCGLCYVHAGRLIFAGFASDPHLVVASRAGDMFDYDYSLTDPGAAWASSGISGMIRNPVTSLFGHGNGCLLLGSPDSIDIIRGDLLVGSTAIEQLAPEVGPLMQSAICKTDDDRTAFLSRMGLHLIAPGCGGAPEMVTHEIPNELMAVNPGAQDTASVCFDNRFGGLHVYVDRNTGTDAHWLFHLATKSWWPMSFAVGTLKMGVNLKRVASLTKSGLLALNGTSVYQFDTESTESITSHCFYGPAKAPPGVKTILQNISITNSEAATSSTWELYAGMSAQEAYADGAKESWTDTNDKQRNYKKWVRRGGTHFYLKHSGTTTQRPCAERVEGEIAVVSAAKREADDA